MKKLGPRQRPQELLTKDQVARRLQKSERTIERWQKIRLIRPRKVFQSVFYDWREVLKAIRSWNSLLNHPDQGPPARTFVPRARHQQTTKQKR
jgi:hypothetical protein